MNVIHGYHAADSQMFLQQIHCDLHRFLLDQALKDLYMLLIRVMNKIVILLTGDRDPEIVVQDTVHHFYDVPVPALIDEIMMHLHINVIVRKIIQIP